MIHHYIIDMLKRTHWESWRQAVAFSDRTDPYEDLSARREAAQRNAEFIARLMDTVFKIPGTSIRVGVDPLLGMIPGVGDALSGLIGTSILFLAAQLGVPKIVQLRMALNILINGLISSIPGVGDLFSLWFKSNVKNANLLRRYGNATMKSSTLSDWLFVGGVIVGLLAVVGLTLAGVVGLIHYLWAALS